MLSLRAFLISALLLSVLSKIALPMSRVVARKTGVGASRKMDKREFIPGNGNSCLNNHSEVSLFRTTLKFLDADFLTDSKAKEAVEGAEEFNLPVFRVDRRLVASVNGGLHYPSVLIFNPDWGHNETTLKNGQFNYPLVSGIKRPKKKEDIAFMTIPELGNLIKTKQVTSRELTEIFLLRLKRYNTVLEAVITYTEELAYMQAKKADDLLDQGVYLGPLHGIPYGLKDIIAVPHYKTTWGSMSFKNQVLDMEAWVYKRLRSAGAVLIAKLVSGSLAYDDIWFGGRTRNPWNIDEFSTGSSAGPAASTSAGFVLGILCLKMTRIWLFGFKS